MFAIAFCAMTAVEAMVTEDSRYTMSQIGAALNISLRSIREFHTKHDYLRWVPHLLTKEPKLSMDEMP